MSDANLHDEIPAAIQRIFEARARALAEPPADEGAAELAAVLVVSLVPEQYGLPLAQVREVRVLNALTPLPGVPAFWAGLVNLRGRLLPVLDLRRYLALEAAPTPARKLVVVASAGLEVAMLVDDVLAVRSLAGGELGPLLGDAPGAHSESVAGITPDLLSMLNLDTLLADPRLVVQSESN